MIVGAIAAVGAAVAVAGLGTMGGFTDSTAPVGTQVDSGVLSIDVSQPGGPAVPFAGGAMVAGDSRTTLIDLVNDGHTPLSAVALNSWATSSSVLDTDAVNGLQLTVQSCSVAWTTSAAAPTCSGTVRSYFSAPIVVTDRVLTGTQALTAGATDHLLLTASLPSSASGDAFEGASSGLNFMFTGVQRNGAAR
ncbi:MAG: uncharacterized protein JWR45_2680 [Blastococcus sp.]|jgi:hypothetical protein|nr:uncharacterized protein [Blastococcus sp.]